MDNNLDTVFVVPGFVKEASGEMLNPDHQDALSLSGYRYDNKAAAWCAGALLRKKACAGEEIPELILEKVAAAERLFQLKDEDFAVIPPKTSLVKVASEGCALAVQLTCNDDYVNACSTLVKSRPGLPYTFRKQAADALLHTEGFNAFDLLPRDIYSKLSKTAGGCSVNVPRTIAALRKRASAAARVGAGAHGNSDIAEAGAWLTKFADALEEKADQILDRPDVEQMIDGVDAVDQALPNGFKDDNDGPAEDDIYNDENEHINEANKGTVDVAGVTIDKSRLEDPQIRGALVELLGNLGLELPVDCPQEDLVAALSVLPPDLNDAVKEIVSQG